MIFQKHIKNALYTEFTRNINRSLCSDLLYKNGLDFFDILYTRKTCKVDPFLVLIVVHSVQLSNKHNPWYYLLFFHCLFLRVLIFQSFQFSSKKKDKKKRWNTDKSKCWYIIINNLCWFKIMLDEGWWYVFFISRRYHQSIHKTEDDEPRLFWLFSLRLPVRILVVWRHTWKYRLISSAWRPARELMRGVGGMRSVLYGNWSFITILQLNSEKYHR